MKQKLFSILVVLLVISCTETENKKTQNDKITFEDVVDLSKVKKVTMYNNSGLFVLTDVQMEKLKNELSTMVYEPNIGVKVGAIGFDLHIDGKKHHVLTRTNGNYIEVNSDLITKNRHLLANESQYCFKTNGVNIDNYKKEK